MLEYKVALSQEIDHYFELTVQANSKDEAVTKAKAQLEACLRLSREIHSDIMSNDGISNDRSSSDLLLAEIEEINYEDDLDEDV